LDGLLELLSSLDDLISFLGFEPIVPVVTPQPILEIII
jgi:hypothetical protein